MEQDPTLTGPGLEKTGKVDPTVVTAMVFAVLGLTPSFWFPAAYFGPVAVPAILAIVGVVFGFIAVFRSLELGDKRLRAWGFIAAGIGLVRLFIYPLAGW